MPATALEPTALTCILAFDARNQLAVRRLGSKAGLAFTGADLPMAQARLESAFSCHTACMQYFSCSAGGRAYVVYFVQTTEKSLDPEIEFNTIERLVGAPISLAPSLQGILSAIDPYLIEVPYLHLEENDFIYKFRPEKDRNLAIYGQDSAASGLYQSQLCVAIKKLARRREGVASEPVTLNFGPVSYIVPSHFGFCLGVKNAIDRAYETLAANPGHRVFMLSELIHNPFVNEDLLSRGLRYLQTDKGVPYTVGGEKSTGAVGELLLWDTLTPEDIVVIPAFGATDEDKRRLVRKGIAVCQYDATCMLVEKVWKAARTFGREGYTVIIHGKAEHEETKATFSNTRRHAHAVVVRNLAETKLLGQIIKSSDPAERARFYEIFAGKHTPGFDVDKHLERIAVVNQTTLLMNETREIITYLRNLYAEKYVGSDTRERVGGSGRNDTLCYATQVNQDALARALSTPLDAAFVLGGKNSSNTYQLYRVCEQTLGPKAFFIQSEANILSRQNVEHYVFPHHAVGRFTGAVELRALWDASETAHKRVLVTGGASCPDGIVQQVITRINSFFPPESLRSIDDVLRDLDQAQ